MEQTLGSKSMHKSKSAAGFVGGRASKVFFRAQGAFRAGGWPVSGAWYWADGLS